MLICSLTFNANLNLFSPEEQKLSVVSKSFETNEEANSVVAIWDMKSWVFVRSGDLIMHEARERDYGLPSILMWASESNLFRKKIPLRTVKFHQKFKVALGPAAKARLKNFLVQHLHNFWTASKRQWNRFWLHNLRAQSGELIMETVFYHSQQFHNEFRMNEPRRHWSGTKKTFLYVAFNFLLFFDTVFRISSQYLMARNKRKNLKIILWFLFC